MGIIVFLVDTSASMNQRTYSGISLLDLAKGAVESFIKIRSRAPNNLDRYMLVTFDEPPFCIKSGWKESLATFTNELKYMKASGTSTLGVVLKETFDLLNLPRASSSIDTYGAGRNPSCQEPAVIIALTDVSRMHNAAGLVCDQLELPMANNVFGSEMTKEPFRWDQRLFSLMLRITGRYPTLHDRANQATPTEVELSRMSDATGGKAYLVQSAKMLQQCLDSIASKVQHTGVVLRFEKQVGVEPSFSTTAASDSASIVNGATGDEPMDMANDSGAGAHNGLGLRPDGGPRTIGKVTALHDEDTREQSRGDQLPAPAAAAAASVPQPWHSCLRMIYVKHDPRTIPSRSHWPIPEGYWQDANMSALPVRRAHPVITFSCISHTPQTVNKLPFDKYELEPSPLTQFLLQNKPPSVCWQVFVEKSSRTGGLGPPFGYLKTSINGNCVSLFVMPYNYPVLFQLLDELQKQKFKPSHALMQDFSRYVYSLPIYYINPLRNALNAFGGRAAASLVAEGLVNVNPTLDAHLNLTKKQGKELYDKVCLQLHRRCNKESGEGNSPYPTKEPIRLQTYRNPFDISRAILVDQVSRMRKDMSTQATGSHQRLQDAEDRHSLPVAQTGNYQEHLKRINPLRDIDVSISGESKTHLFGNPFRLESKGRGVGLDEANEALVGVGDSPVKRPASPPGSPTPKRRLAIPRGQRFKDMSLRLCGTAPALLSFLTPSTPNESSNIGGNGGGAIGSGRPPANHGDQPVASFNSGPANLGPGPAGTGVATGTAATGPITATIPGQHAHSPSSSLSSSIAAAARNHVMASPLPVGSVAVDPPVPALSTPAPPPSAPSSHALTGAGHPRPPDGSNNSSIRTQMMKEVRKPGKSSDRVLEMLKELKGSNSERVSIGKEIRKEAMRFKRNKLCTQIDNWIKNQLALESTGGL